MYVLYVFIIYMQYMYIYFIYMYDITYEKQFFWRLAFLFAHKMHEK